MEKVELDELLDSQQVIALLGFKDMNALHVELRKGTLVPPRKLGKCYIFVRSQVLEQWASYQASRAGSDAA